MTSLAEIGYHNWQDYTDYWREADAEWLQSRSILRVNTPADLTNTSIIPPPGAGQVVYVKDVSASQKDVLYLRSSAGAWVQYPSGPKNLYASTDTTSQVILGHHPGNTSSVVPALALSPTGVAVITDFTAQGTVFKVTAADVQIKTGAVTALLTTDAVGLVSNVPIRATGLISSGTISATGALTAGSVTAGTFSTTAGGTLNVSGASTLAAVTASSLTAAGGLTVSSGRYAGDATGALIQAVGGSATVKVSTGATRFDGGSTILANQPDVYNNVGIRWFNGNPGTHFGWLGPVVYSASDPGGPNGTIWVIP